VYPVLDVRTASIPLSAIHAQITLIVIPVLMVWPLKEVELFHMTVGTCVPKTLTVLTTQVHTSTKQVPSACLAIAAASHVTDLTPQIVRPVSTEKSTNQTMVLVKLVAQMAPTSINMMTKSRRCTSACHALTSVQPVLDLQVRTVFS
jgi:hypothetical protein